MPSPSPAFQKRGAFGHGGPVSGDLGSIQLDCGAEAGIGVVSDPRRYSTRAPTGASGGAVGGGSSNHAASTGEPLMTEHTQPNRTRKSARKLETELQSGAGSAGAGLEVAAGGKTPSPPAAKVGSKAARVVALLQRKEGASLEDLVSETGWQPHTTRAALTGLRKKGLAITSEKVDGARRYQAAAQ